jgi:hypothetical protein
MLLEVISLNQCGKIIMVSINVEKLLWYQSMWQNYYGMLLWVISVNQCANTIMVSINVAKLLWYYWHNQCGKTTTVY